MGLKASASTTVVVTYCSASKLAVHSEPMQIIVHSLTMPLGHPEPD